MTKGIDSTPVSNGTRKERAAVTTVLSQSACVGAYRMCRRGFVEADGRLFPSVQAARSLSARPREYSPFNAYQGEKALFPRAFSTERPCPGHG